MKPDKETLLYLHKEYHARLMQDYDLSWQQIKILTSLSVLLVSAYALINQKLPDVEFIHVINLIIPILGFFISLAGLITFKGALKGAQEIRTDLAQLEELLNLPLEARRYSNFSDTFHNFLIKIDFIELGKTMILYSVLIVWFMIVILSFQI
jgi:hypothetical protein